IWHTIVIGGKPPMRTKNVAVIESQREICITDIYCKKHKESLNNKDERFVDFTTRSSFLVTGLLS
ncbi:MAG TPA: hypothetical protein VKE92_06655, partial [Anaerolineales bacterium]|nr:hypothetical protein [Anaerolineales bacterium]